MAENLQQRKRRPIVIGIVFLLILYAFLCTVVWALQRRLIYFPTKLSQQIAEQAAAHEGFFPWKNNAGETIGWRLPAKGDARGSVLITHGNAGCALNRTYLALPIHEAAPVDVYILEYPGYGPRNGSPEMRSLLAAGEEAFDLLPKETPKYLVSESLGTGVAAHLAKVRGDKISGMACFVPYNNFASLAQKKMPVLPVFLILRDRYNPESWMTDYKGPAKFIVAESDEVIPARFGLKLHDSFRGPKNLEVIAGAHHNDVAEQTPEWWKNVFTFWRENAGLK